jgi:hypothetical protein
MKFLIGIFSILMLISINPAFAYLDPGTGSMLLQVILGGVAAVGVAIKLYWHKIRVAVGLGRKTEKPDEPE